MFRVLFVYATAFLLVLSLQAAAVTVHVPYGEPTIQAGIDAASYGDTVLVVSGTYYEHDITMKSGVCLRSESGHASAVTIDAQQHHQWAYAIGCADTDPSTIIMGFTLTGGYYTPGGALWCRDSSLTLRNVSFIANYSDEGGGLNCLNSSVALENVAFMDNWANLAGGGLFASDGSALTLTDCVFARNTASPEDDALGGGVYCTDSSVTLTDCQFVVNAGSGLHCVESETSVSGCAFVSNTGRGLIFTSPEGAGSCSVLECEFAENSGGGVECAYGSGDVTIGDCDFLGNTAAWQGGGLFANSYTLVTLRGCTFANNEAPYGGGASFGAWQACPVISGCTFVGNHASEYGAAILRDGNWGWGGVEMSNTIVALSTGAGALAISGDSVISCSDVWGNEAGDWVGLEHLLPDYGNICEDPLFCGDEQPTQPYSLHANSPCAPAGNTGCGLIGAFDVGCEETTIEATSWGAIKRAFR
jgi:hypothetical protein